MSNVASGVDNPAVDTCHVTACLLVALLHSLVGTFALCTGASELACCLTDWLADVLSRWLLCELLCAGVRVCRCSAKPNASDIRTLRHCGGDCDGWISLLIHVLRRHAARYTLF
jgi:hypothetical protein